MAVQVAGSINVDLIQSVERLPRPGETVLAHASRRLPGGKGANQAVAAARMGAQTLFTGAVGDDEAGQWMLDVLTGEGIDTARLATAPDMATGLALIAVSRDGENQIIVNPGANAAIHPVAVQDLASDARVLLAQQEIPRAALEAFFGAPGSDAALRILNAAPAFPETASLFALVDILIVNQHELAIYLGLDQPPHGIDQALAARQLIRREGQVVIVTLGAGGALAVWADRHLHVPAARVTPLDTIGAGDCFCGALAALLDSGWAIEQALPLANVAAALCTQRDGAIPAMPTRAEVEERLASGA